MLWAEEAREVLMEKRSREQSVTEEWASLGTVRSVHWERQVPLGQEPM